MLSPVRGMLDTIAQAQARGCIQFSEVLCGWHIGWMPFAGLDGEWLTCRPHCRDEPVCDKYVFVYMNSKGTVASIEIDCSGALEWRTFNWGLETMLGDKYLSGLYTKRTRGSIYV